MTQLEWLAATDPTPMAGAVMSRVCRMKGGIGALPGPGCPAKPDKFAREPELRAADPLFQILPDAGENERGVLDLQVATRGNRLRPRVIGGRRSHHSLHGCRIGRTSDGSVGHPARSCIRVFR